MAIRLTSDQYHEEALREFPRYSLDNSWFKFEFPGGEFDMAAPVSYVFAGWAAYEKAQEAGAKMLLLGSEKLRTDEALITNFGLSSAKGVQEEKEDREKRKIDPTYKSPAEKAVAGAVAERAAGAGRVTDGLRGPVPGPDPHLHLRGGRARTRAAAGDAHRARPVPHGDHLRVARRAGSDHAHVAAQPR